MTRVEELAAAKSDVDHMIRMHRLLRHDEEDPANPWCTGCASLHGRRQTIKTLLYPMLYGANPHPQDLPN